MPSCPRCYYRVGVTETRCRICGEKASRLRMSVVAVASLLSGMTIGLFAIVLFRL